MAAVFCGHLAPLDLTAVGSIIGRVEEPCALPGSAIGATLKGTALLRRLRERILSTADERAIVLVRLLVGLVVFFPEGVQKLLFPAALGAGRFASIGIPAPSAMGPFVGVVEILCGGLIIIGLLTRLATVPLIIIAVVAILSTKIPILLGHDFLMFHLPHLSRYGFWSMLHEARTDFCMLLGCLYLLIVGGGGWSLDLWLVRRPDG